MSITPELKPTNTAYLQANTVFQQLKYNTKDVTLYDSMAADATPFLRLDGSGRAMLFGQITVDTSSVTANMPLCTLPDGITPAADGWYPVTVLRAGVPIANSVKVESGGDVIDSITVTDPGVYLATDAVPTWSWTGPGNGASFTTKMKAVAYTVGTAQSSTGSYAPSNTITLTGGTFTTATILTVTHTQLVSATVAAAGASGTPGAVVLTGTTGTGTKFQINGTIGGGGTLSSVSSIVVAGNYTVNPTLLTAEPVTGGGLVGATLSIKIGVLTATISTAGVYTVYPSNPVSQGASSGPGTGFTANLSWGALSPTIVNGGTGFTADSLAVLSGDGGGEGDIVLGDSTNGLVTLLTQPVQNDIVCLDSVNFFTESY